MEDTETSQIKPSRSVEKGPGAFLFDLALYLPVMFLVREIYFPSIGFILNGLFWSLTTLALAAWRMRARGISWANLGICRPKSLKVAAIASVAILGMAIGSIVLFQIIYEQIPLGLAPDTSDDSAIRKFGDLKNNWGLLLAIIPLIWLESLLEEVLDRGFLINWIERLFSSTTFAIVLAVVLQAVVFGFRHSYALSERSVTVGLIGLAMGIGYVAFGRNLWPLIIVHCVLNTMSMIGRVA